MPRSDEEKSQRCLSALRNCGFDEIKYGISITFDGKFQKSYDATSVLSKEGDSWHYFVFERDSTFDNAFFANTDAALNFLFWNFVRPKPNYPIIYRDQGPGFDGLDESEDIKAFLFSCGHLGISPRRYHIDAGNNPYSGNEDAWVCSKGEKGWRVSHARPGGDDIVGDFDNADNALSFVFWTLTNAETYQQRYDKIAAAS